MIYTARKIESMCDVALRFGFANCDRLRSPNRHMNGRARLTPGDEIFIPQRQERVEQGQVETLHQFQLQVDRVPSLKFIREDGHGYGVGNPALTPAEVTARGGNFQPERDPEITELNLMNYIADRGGTGSAANNFPAATFFGHDPLGSQDPDHFKVQVHAPLIPDAVTDVTIKLYALRPNYFKRRVNSRDIVEHAAQHYTRPARAERTLEVTCHRIGKTKFFRSPYLRLVPTEADKAARPQQCLLVTDYFDEPGALNYQKFYTEILHQKVEAEALLRACQRTGREKCGVYKIANIGAGQTLHLAIHVVNDGNVTLDEVRAGVYHWTRRIFAPAHVRPVIEKLQLVPEPHNILAIANSAAASAGKHASGRRNVLGQASQMRFTVDGNAVSVTLQQGWSPSRTADEIAAAIKAVPAMANYEVRKFQANRENFTASATRTLPFDVLVRKAVPAGGGERPLANVRNATSNDRPHNNFGGQTIEALEAFLDVDGMFRVSTSTNGTIEQRALIRNFNVDNCMNIYLFGAIAIKEVPPTTGRYDGWSPLGNFNNLVTAVGPSVFMRSSTAAGPNDVSGIRRPLVMAHEIGHPMMHMYHIKAPPTPLKDAPPAASAGRARSGELMDPQILDDVDAKDMSKHISDAPIVCRYHLDEFHPQIAVVDGTTAPARTTPVRRLATVAGFYGILRGAGQVPLDPIVTDIPDRPPQRPPRRPFGAPAPVNPT